MLKKCELLLPLLFMACGGPREPDTLESWETGLKSVNVDGWVLPSVWITVATMPFVQESALPLKTMQKMKAGLDACSLTVCNA